MKFYQKWWFVGVILTSFLVTLIAIGYWHIQKMEKIRNSPEYRQQVIANAIAIESQSSTYCGTMDHREFTVLKVVPDELLGINRVVAETEGEVIVSQPVNPNAKFTPGDKVKLVDVCHVNSWGATHEDSTFVPASTAIPSAQ